MTPRRARVSVPVQLLERRGAAAIFMWVVVPLAVVLAVAAIVATIRLQLTPEFPPGRLTTLEPGDELPPLAPPSRGQRVDKDPAVPPSRSTEPPTRESPLPARRTVAPDTRRTQPGRKRARTRRSISPTRTGSMSTLRVRCAQRVDVRIQRFGRFLGVTTLSRQVPPGAYTVTFSRNGRSLGRVAINLVAGQALELDCP